MSKTRPDRKGLARIDQLPRAVFHYSQPVQGNPSTDGKNPERWATPLENDHWITNQPRKDNRQEQLPQMVQKWATPTATQAEKPQGPNSKQVGLSNQVKWPTPNTMDVLPPRPTEKLAEANRTRGGRKNRQALSNLREAVHSPKYQGQWPQMVQKWATPEAQNQTGYQTSHGKRFPRLGAQTNGKLNPNWVEQLMGLDPGRTQLPTEWTG